MRATQKNSNSFKCFHFGEWLTANEYITEATLNLALAHQQKYGGRLGEVLSELEILSETDVKNALADYLGLECITLDDITSIDMNTARSLPENIAKRFLLAAIGEQDGHIVLAMADPLNVIAIDTVAVKLNRKVISKVATKTELRNALEAIYHGSDIHEKRMRDIVQIEIENELDSAEENSEEITISEAEASDAPVIQFVNAMLAQAIESRASDIHIEPQERQMSVRMRVDGVLRDMVPPPKKMQAAVLARLKIMSELDIAERRLPQDGRFKIRASDRNIDVRVSTIPTIYGEKIVLRILDTLAVNHDIDHLGFEPKSLRLFKTTLSQPHGIIIVTGPTGSGKSTTLYSALNYLRDPRKNITTVEDPVEYRLHGINQIQVKPEINLDFAICLRAILRQDPDIILIGEIRDRETMEIAIKASLTGHLVLSTFHTNDAPSAISRLNYMGLEPYLLASTLNLVIAQRLVRKLCPKCIEAVEPDANLLSRLRLSEEELSQITFFRGKGCKSCGGTGYKGRTPIFEFLTFDNEMRRLVAEGASEAVLRKASRERGNGSLLDSGIMLLKEGLTSPEEILATTFTEEIIG